MSRDPRFMVERWRGRIKKSAESIPEESDPIRRKKLLMMLSKQRETLKEWEIKFKNACTQRQK
jgi:hypothetical protein